MQAEGQVVTAAAVAAAAAVVAFLLIPGRRPLPAASEPEPTDGGDLDPSEPAFRCAAEPSQPRDPRAHDRRRDRH